MWWDKKEEKQVVQESVRKVYLDCPYTNRRVVCKEVGSVAEAHIISPKLVISMVERGQGISPYGLLVQDINYLLLINGQEPRITINTPIDQYMGSWCYDKLKDIYPRAKELIKEGW
jgi:hypothetical protein